MDIIYNLVIILMFIYLSIKVIGFHHWTCDRRDFMARVNKRFQIKG
jgi:hypothetical protein